MNQNAKTNTTIENKVRNAETISIGELLGKLGVDFSHQAADTILLAVRKHLITAQRNRIGDPDKMSQITDVVEHYLSERVKPRKLSIGSRSKNRLEGYVAELPIAAFLTQDPLTYGPQFRLFQAFVLVLLLSSQSSQSSLGHALNIQRRVSKNRKRAIAFKSLPEPNGNNGNYFFKLCTLIESKPLTQFDEEALGAIHSIVRAAEKVKWNDRNIKQHRPINRVFSREPAYIIEQESVLVDLEFTDSIDLGLIPEPDFEYVIQSKPEITQNNIETGSDQDNRELRPQYKAKASRSAHWLRSVSAATLRDSNLLDMFDRQIFSCWLDRSFLNIGRDFDIAGFLGGSYFFGRRIEEIAALKIGIDLTKTTYVKQVRLPSDGYVPGESHIGNYEPTTESIELPIPQIIRPWIKSLDTEENFGKTIGDACSLSIPDISSACIAAIKHIRGTTPISRIKIPRIQSHLRTLTAAISHDPVAVYVLTGRDSDRPPATAYYVIREEPFYVDLYMELVRHMSGEEL